MKQKLYVGLDQGSGSSKVAIIDSEGNELFSDALPVHTSYPTEEVAEQDGEELYQSLLQLLGRAKDQAKIFNGNIFGIGISLQRSGVLAWDKKGMPLCPVITWRDSRYQKEILKLRSSEAKIYEISGLPLTYHYAAYKIGSLQKRFPNAWIGTLDSFFLYRISECKSYLSEESHASRSQLYSLVQRGWDQQLCNFFGVEHSKLPQITPSFHSFGKLLSVPVTAVLGDQQAAFFALKEIAPTTLIIGTVGTLILPRESIDVEKGFLTGVAVATERGISYQLEASINAPGATLKEISSLFPGIDGPARVDGLLKNYCSATKDPVAYFTFKSSGSPDWITDGKNLFDKPYSSDLQAIAALIENIGNWIYFNIETLVAKGILVKPETLVVAGGGAEISYLLKYLRALCGIELSLVRNYQGSAYGAALAAVSSGTGRVTRPQLVTERIVSDFDPAVVNARYQVWKNLKKG